MRIKTTLTEFIQKSSIIHHNKYDYRKSVYIDARTNVIITCPIHGDFTQAPHSHYNKRGCSLCSGNKKLCKESFIKKSNEVHSSKYDYSKVVYKDRYEKVTITCPQHGEFLQVPKNHMGGSGCLKCKTSKGESKIIDFLNENDVEYIHQHWFNDCRSDSGKRQVLRFDFLFHHKNY